MSALDDVFDISFQEPRGATVVCNIVDCLDEALIDAPFVCAFLDAAEAAFSQERPKTTMNLVGMLAKVARGELPVSLAGPPPSLEAFFAVAR